MTTFLFLVALLLSRPLFWLLDGALGALGAAALVQVAVLILAIVARRPDDVPLGPGCAGGGAGPDAARTYEDARPAPEHSRAPWTRRGVLGSLAAGVGLFVLTLPVYAVASALVGSPPAALRPVGAGGWSLAVVNSASAAVGEELAFRGALWARWRGSLGAGWAAALSALAFGGYHMSALQLAPTFLLGLGLVWLVHHQGHLAGAMLAHLVFNALGFLLLALMPAA